MSYFTAIMHHIRFRPQTPLGSALDPLAGFKWRISIGEGKDQEAVAVLEGPLVLTIAHQPP